MELYQYLSQLSDERLAEIGNDILNFDESGTVKNDSLLRLVQNLYKGDKNLNRIISEVKYEVLLRYTKQYSNNY